MTLTQSQVDTLARELIDPACEEFSIAIGNEDFTRVQERADAIEIAALDAEHALRRGA